MVLVFDVAHRIPYVISDGGEDVFPAGCFALIGFASDDLAIAPERGVRDAITAHPRLVHLEGLPVNPWVREVAPIRVRCFRL